MMIAEASFATVCLALMTNRQDILIRFPIDWSTELLFTEVWGKTENLLFPQTMTIIYTIFATPKFLKKYQNDVFLLRKLQIDQ